MLRSIKTLAYLWIPSLSSELRQSLAPLLAAVIGGCGQSGSLQPANAAQADHVASRAIPLWSAPETIPGHNLGTGDTPRAVALGARGDGVAAWSEATFDGHSVVRLVRAAVHPAGGHWQPPSTLSRTGLSPQVAVDAGGDAIAVWESPFAVVAAMRPAGGVWSAPESLVAGADEDPQVASDTRGDAIVVWSRLQLNRSGRGYTGVGVQAAVRPAGDAFASAQAISSSENAHNPRIAMNARGDAIVAWEVDTSRACLVRAAFRPGDGRWSVPRTTAWHPSLFP